MCFKIFYNEKTTFHAIKTTNSKSRKFGIFPKGLVHGFGPKLAIFPTFLFKQSRLGECVFSVGEHISLGICVFYAREHISLGICGLDNISAKLVWECTDLISIPLCNIFNNSLSSGLFPDDWKCARVTPLFKQGKVT